MEGETGKGVLRPRLRIAKRTKRASASTGTEAKAAKENAAIRGTRSVRFFLSQTEDTARNREKRRKERRSQSGVPRIRDDDYLLSDKFNYSNIKKDFFLVLL